MRRRDVLALGASLIGTIAARRVLAQPDQPLVRAAVVIGVDQVGQGDEFPRLKAGASSAKNVAEWLSAEGFEVKTFLDTDSPVGIRAIKVVIKELVGRGTLDQLVVYFSGHGCLVGANEFWLLSGAPDDTGEAISFGQCYDVAQQTPIPNIVFVSDACRSTVASLRAQNLTGGQIFPNSNGTGDVEVKVDKFFASRIGQSAFEVPIGDNAAEYQALYTSVFLDAFVHPDADMVVPFRDLQIIPNRKLENYLRREVPKRAEAISLKLRQRPQTDVVSGDDKYIGRLATVSRVAPAGEPEPTEAEAASATLANLGPQLGSFQPQYTSASVPDTQRLAGELGIYAARDTILAAPTHQEVRVSTGFVVVGTAVENVFTDLSTVAEVVSHGDQTIVRVDPSMRAATVALQFSDGSGTVVACLRDFVGNIVVDQGLVSSVSYDFGGDQPDDYIRKLRATVAAVAQLGGIRIPGEGEVRREQARELGNTIRMGKFADPTLGLYAAYAYNEAALTEGVRSVAEIMRGDLGVFLFDVAMLAGELNDRTVSSEVVPFCPMLSQGWDLLQARNIRLPDGIENARGHLRPALWTTLEPGGMDIVITALQRGQLQ